MVKKFIKKYWVGILLGFGVGMWFFHNYEAPITMSLQAMSITPVEAPTTTVSGTISAVFGAIGSVVGGLINKVVIK